MSASPCGSGGYPEEGSDIEKVTLEGSTTLGFTAYIWSHEVDWDWSCTGGATVDYTDVDVRNEFTDWAVSYNGVVGNDDDMSPDDFVFTSYRQAHYNSGIPFVGSAVNSYPTSEISVYGDGVGLTTSHI